MAAPKSPAMASITADEESQPTVEELVAQLEEQKRLRVTAELNAEQARTTAAQAIAEIEVLRVEALKPVPMVSGGLFQNIEGKVLEIGTNLIHDVRLTQTITTHLRTLGHIFQDHRLTTTRGPDGAERPHWQGFERPLMHTDLLSIREEPFDDGYVVITGDGKKYRNVTP